VDQTVTKVSLIKRAPKPYVESAENAEKPLSIRHILMNGEVDKDKRRAWLDEIVAAYTPDSVGQNRFLTRMSEWMLSWYDTLACNGVALKTEDQALLDGANNTIEAYVDDSDFTTADKDEYAAKNPAYAEMQAQRSLYLERRNANMETWHYWNIRRGRLATAVRTFVQDFHSTDY